jgi:hypothetical protein
VDQSNIEGFIATGIQTFLLKCRIMLAFIGPSYFRRIWVRASTQPQPFHQESPKATRISLIA